MHLIKYTISILFKIINGSIFMGLGMIAHFFTDWLIRTLEWNQWTYYLIIFSFLLLPFLILIYSEQLLYVAMLQSAKVKQKEVKVKSAVRLSWILTGMFICITLIALYSITANSPTATYKSLVFIISAYFMGHSMLISYNSLYLPDLRGLKKPTENHLS